MVAASYKCSNTHRHAQVEQPPTRNSFTVHDDNSYYNQSPKKIQVFGNWEIELASAAEELCKVCNHSNGVVFLRSGGQGSPFLPGEVLLCACHRLRRRMQGLKLSACVG
jgi:hypothetical protein